MRDRSRFSFFAKMGVGIILLAGIIAFVDVDSIVNSAKGADFFWIAVAVSLLPINLWLETAKWRLVLSSSVDKIDLREAAGSVLAGYALGFLTPARLGDYAGRVLYLNEQKKWSVLVLALIDRMYSVWTYCLVGTIVLGFQLEGSLPGPRGAWWLIFGLGVSISIVIGIFIVRPGTFLTLFGPLLRWRATNRWRHQVEAMRTVNPNASLKVMLLALIRYGVICTQFMVLVLAFSPFSPVAAVYAGVALVFFAKTVIPSISLFDLGIRESTAIFFLGFFGVAAVAAFNAALLLFAINLALPALAGIAFVPTLKSTRSPRTAHKLGTVESRAG